MTSRSNMKTKRVPVHDTKTCAECKRWRDMKHPLQSACDEWYRVHYRHRAEVDRREACQHLDMRKMAREALAPYPSSADSRANECTCYEYHGGHQAGCPMARMPGDSRAGGGE